MIQPIYRTGHPNYCALSVIELWSFSLETVKPGQHASQGVIQSDNSDNKVPDTPFGSSLKSFIIDYMTYTEIG